MEHKKYSAFISSNFNSLRNERSEVINCLLDAQIIPICMEHFTATTNENFEYIKTLIEQSDIFIMILGDIYGSCDRYGVSWTENEYIYAQSIKRICYVLKTNEYNILLSRYQSGETLTELELKQIQFGENISYAQSITTERPISRIIQQIISGTNFDSCKGWIRHSEKYDIEWQEKNRYLDLGGKWFHLHLNEDNHEYIRAGSVTITQSFTPDKYTNLHFNANNYNILEINTEQKTLILNKLKKTVWSGDYMIKDGTQILGVYNAERYFKGKYGELTIEKGISRGIHILNIIDDDADGDSTDNTTTLSGTFNDVSPSPKTGLLYLFRTEEARYKFLLENYQDTLRSKL